jgi:hypothetical protein
MKHPVPVSPRPCRASRARLSGRGRGVASRARGIAGHARAVAALAAAALLLTMASGVAIAAQEPATAGEAKAPGAVTVTEPGGVAGTARPAGAAAAGAAASTAGAGLATAICDSTTALTAIGVDTESGLMLFAVAGAGGGAGSWIVALGAGGAQAGKGAHGAGAPDAGAPDAAAAPAAGARDAETAATPEARAYPERQGSRFGGSVGPGPVLALESCGPNCLQPVRFGNGAWQPLGEPVTVPAASTVAATYDAGGTPWLVAHTAATQEGLVQALAFRYEGREWQSRGSLAVTAVGQPQAVPAPQRRDAVISGTGLFSAGGPPSTWVLGLPGVAPARRGQLLALTPTDAAYLAADGVAYLSGDAGKTWRRSAWTPWGGGDTTGMWRQGTDYVIDLPVGDHYGALQLAWYDRRSAAAERVVLTRLGPGGTWSELAAAPVDVTTRNGEHLPVTQALVPRADAWILLSGCAATATGSGLVLRTFEKGQLSEPRFVPIVLEPRAPRARPPALNP